MVLASCEEYSEKGNYAEFSVVASHVDFLKSATSWDCENVPNCGDLEAEYAKVYFEIPSEDATIDGMYEGSVMVDLNTVKGALVTNSIKVVFEEGISCADIKVTGFELIAMVDDEEVVVKATPRMGSAFMSYINNETNGLRTIEVCAYEKPKFTFEVLCYEPAYYADFGFITTEVIPATVREICVFGDICLTDESVLNAFLGALECSESSWPYWTSPYKYQVCLDDGYASDIIPYVRVTVVDEAEGMKNFGCWFDDDDLEFTNFWDVNECIPVRWTDYDDMDDEITITIEILVPSTCVRDGYGYCSCWKWITIFEDTFAADGDFEGMITDGFLDFVMGDCHDEADLVLDELVCGSQCPKPCDPQ